MRRIENGETRIQQQEAQSELAVESTQIDLPISTPPVAQNANTQRAAVQNYGHELKARINNLFDVGQQDNSPLIGGSAGSTAAQFSQHESQVRGSGKITITNVEMYRGHDNKLSKLLNRNHTADLVHKVKEDFNKIAPGTIVTMEPGNWDRDNILDAIKTTSPVAATVIEPAEPWERMVADVTPAPLEKRVKGHDAGYRLVDQLKNNKHKIAIHLFENGGTTLLKDPTESFGSVAKPGKGSAADILYHPYSVKETRVRDLNGKLTYAEIDPAIILGHEAIHASHFQRGTRSNIKGDHGKPNIFEADGKQFRENTETGIGFEEEFRTMGMDGHSHGKEPTENLLRLEQPGNKEVRVSYQSQSNLHHPIKASEAFAIRASNRLQMLRDVAIDAARGSGTSAGIGAAFGAVSAIVHGKDATGTAADAALGAGIGVAQEFAERAINGPRAATSGMTASSLRAATSQLKGTAVVGTVFSTAFAVHDQWKNLQTDATRAHAIGVIASEAAVGMTTGVSGAYAGAMAGATIGSVVPVVGTVVGGIVGFAVGAGAGYLADKGLREIGVDNMIAAGVTVTAETVSSLGHQASQTVSNVASNVSANAKNLFGRATHSLSAIFG